MEERAARRAQESSHPDRLPVEASVFWHRQEFEVPDLVVPLTPVDVMDLLPGPGDYSMALPIDEMVLIALRAKPQTREVVWGTDSHIAHTRIRRSRKGLARLGRSSIIPACSEYRPPELSARIPESQRRHPGRVVCRLKRFPRSLKTPGPTKAGGLSLTST